MMVDNDDFLTNYLQKPYGHIFFKSLLLLNVTWCIARLFVTIQDVSSGEEYF